MCGIIYVKSRKNLYFFVGRLAVVRLPFTFADFKFIESSLKGRIFGTARIYAERNFARGLRHMADAHLREVYAVERTLYTKVVLPAAKSVPDLFHTAVNGGGRPVGISVHRHNTAKVLKDAVFVLTRCLYPVFAVEVGNHAALVKALPAFKPRPYRERKVFFVGRRLQHGRTVVSEVVVGALPQVGVRRRDDGYFTVLRGKAPRLSRPYPICVLKIKLINK